MVSMVPSTHVVCYSQPSRTPCDVTGDNLEPGLLPPPPDGHAEDDYSPFGSRAEFELAELLYVEEEMSAGKIDKLLQLLADVYDTQPPFKSSQKWYTLIDTTKQGDVLWNGFSVSYNGAHPPEGVPQPPWMNDKHEVWFRDPLQVLENQIANPNFNDLMDLSPKQVYHKGKCQYNNLMSGNWAWEQAVSCCDSLVALINVVRRMKSRRMSPPMEQCLLL
jgi:hypothetical protein